MNFKKMGMQPSRLSKIIRGIEKSILEMENSKDDSEIRDSVNNAKIDISKRIEKTFEEDENIEYRITSRSGNGNPIIDVRPLNLYTSCMFLGFKVDSDCPEEGQAEFSRVTIMYDHKDGMTIVPKDPLDDLDDIIQIF